MDDSFVTGRPMMITERLSHDFALPLVVHQRP